MSRRNKPSWPAQAGNAKSHQATTNQPSTSKSNLKPATTASNNSKGVLYLKQNNVKFERPAERVSVFFDECNREIITLTSGIDTNKTRVVFQSTDGANSYQLLLPVDKRIHSIKLNPGRTVLAYQIEKSNIEEFINVRVPAAVLAATTAFGGDAADGATAAVDSAAFSFAGAGSLPAAASAPTMALELGERRYVQPTRTKNSKLMGFLWTGPLELVMITDLSVEYYHVDPVRHLLKHIKSFQSPTNWFVYQPPQPQPATSPPSRPTETDNNNGDRRQHQQQQSSVLMVSTGSIGNSIQPYLFTRGQIVRLQRFDVEGNWHGSDKLERSITIASIYGWVRLLVLQHESLNFKSRGAQILIYTVDHESGITSKTHTLDLDLSGKFAINILDNLIIAHDQPSKSSFIFDIMIESTEKSDCPQHFVSFIDRQPLRPMRLGANNEHVELYSLNWVFFQPNFIIDVKMGILLTLQIDLMSLPEIIQDNLMLLDFLAHRVNSEQIIVSKCRAIVAGAHQVAIGRSQRQGNPLVDVSSTFELLGKLVISAPELERKLTTENTSQTSLTPKNGQSEISDQCFAASILQEDVYRSVFRQLETTVDNEEDPAHLHFVMSTLLEFIFVVRKLGKNVEFCIYEQLIKCLVKRKRFYQLVLMVRSEIFKNSKQLACLLLSLRTQYPPAGQLGLDMLYRLDCLTDLIETFNQSSSPVTIRNNSTSRLALEFDCSFEIDSN